MKCVEELLSSTSTTDKKNKLNRFNKHINKDVLDQIERGITSEELDEMVHKGVPIFKYQTQITIHGLFPLLENNYVYGYKNIFQNKNKSIGVKYNAIDEEKRQRIAKRLKPLGILYNRNSTSTMFQKIMDLTEESLKHIKEVFENVDTRLFIGTKRAWVGDVWGRKFVVLDIVINGIYENDIEVFLQSIGATKEVLAEYTNKQEKEREERDREWNEQQKKRQEKRDEETKKHSTELQWLKDNLELVKKTNEPGTYIVPTHDYDCNFIFKVYTLNIEGRQKFPRKSETEYKTLKEALNHTNRSSGTYYNSQTFRGTVSGYKLK